MRDLGSYDYVIVGAGSAGCVLANRLSADPSVNVLLLEAGGRDSYIWIHIPVGYLYTMYHPRTDWGFSTEADPGLNGRALGYPRGKVLGGCSSINGMIYMRGQARDYDGWRQLGLAGWGWEDVLPYFIRSQDQAAVEPGDSHGVGGEWRVENPRVRWDILDAFRDAAEQAGIPKVDDFNCGDNEGSSYFHVNQRRGVRWNTAKAFLRPAQKRFNLKVVTGAHVRRLLLEGKRAAGVEFDVGGEPAKVEASGEVILSAGAIGSPQLLQLSGVGPADLLRAFDIPVLHDLKGVGENLQDHLQIRCAYKVQGIKTLNETSVTLWDKMKIAIEYLLYRSGPMSMAPSQLGLFARTDPAFETPNVEYHVQPLTLERFGQPLDPFPAFTASVANIRPESRGTVRIKSPDAGVPPAIRPNYLSTPGDRQVAADSIRLTRRIVAQPALARYRPEEFRPGAEYQSEEELAKAAGDISTTIFHPVGTAKMGTDSRAVVDERLRVRGLAALRVVDASVMPMITSGNTNSPVIMIAEKAADMICEDRRRR